VTGGGRLRARVAKLEHARRGPPSCCAIELPDEHNAWSDDPDVAEAGVRAAVAEHQERTGYAGPVLIGPVPCAIEEEWLRLHGHGAGRP
jgi:hypothetical protein